MAELSPVDQRLLELLLEQELITKPQQARLRAGLEKGLSFFAAVQATPLVDTVKLGSAQSLAAQQVALAASSGPTPPPFVPVGARDEDADLVIEESHATPIALGDTEFQLRNLGPVNNAGDDEEDDDGDVAIDLDAPTGFALIEDSVDEDAPDPDQRETHDEVSMLSTELLPVEEAPPPPPPPSSSAVPKPKDWDKAGLPTEAPEGFVIVPVPPTPKAHPLPPVPANGDELMDLDFDDDFELPEEPLPIEDLDDELDLGDFGGPLTAPAVAAAAPKPPAPVVPPAAPTQKKTEPSAFKPEDALSVLDEALGLEDTEPLVPPSNLDPDLELVIDEAFSGIEAPEEKPEPAIAAPSAGDRDLSTVAPFPGFDRYERSGFAIQSFDLSKDEGIELIGKVNHLLTDAMDTESSAIVILTASTDDNVLMYDENYRLAEHQKLPGDQAAKVANRLKAMAKLESWRGKGAQCGVCTLILDGLPRRAYVEAEPHDGGEILTVYFPR